MRSAEEDRHLINGRVELSQYAMVIVKSGTLCCQGTKDLFSGVSGVAGSAPARIRNATLRDLMPWNEQGL
jgi:hypothetical protein